MNTKPVGRGVPDTPKMGFEGPGNGQPSVCFADISLNKGVTSQGNRTDPYGLFCPIKVSNYPCKLRFVVLTIFLTATAACRLSSR